MPLDLQQPFAASSAPAVAMPNRRLRVAELCLVLGVAFSTSVVGSIFELFSGGSLSSHYDNARLASGMCHETAALALLAYILYRQQRTWRDLTETPHWKDLLRAVGLLLLAGTFYAVVYYIVQNVSFILTGGWLYPKSLKSLLAVPISILSISFMILNPFFEELIVRAYLITEVRELGGSAAAAVIVSTVLQVSYHLYQGWLNASLVGTTFLIFSIYYVRTRRIAPIVLVHMLFDVSALLRYHG